MSLVVTLSIDWEGSLSIIMLRNIIKVLRSFERRSRNMNS